MKILKNTKQNWVISFGRLRIGYVNRPIWITLGYPIRNWYFRHDILTKEDLLTDEIIKKAFQVTILGLQIGYMYYGKPA